MITLEDIKETIEKNEFRFSSIRTLAVAENENYVEELTLRHKNQLTYYKKACELMFERSIDRVIIYSVPLAKNVEVKI